MPAVSAQQRDPAWPTNLKAATACCRPPAWARRLAAATVLCLASAAFCWVMVSRWLAALPTRPIESVCSALARALSAIRSVTYGAWDTRPCNVVPASRAWAEPV